jgi:hypothetical protein
VHWPEKLSALNMAFKTHNDVLARYMQDRRAPKLDDGEPVRLVTGQNRATKNYSHMDLRLWHV